MGSRQIINFDFSREGVGYMRYSQNDRYDRLMNSGMPNFITMQNLPVDERVALLNKSYSESKKKFIQNVKKTESAKRHKDANVKDIGQSYSKLFWI